MNSQNTPKISPEMTSSVEEESSSLAVQQQTSFPLWEFPEVLLYHMVGYAAGPTLRAKVLCHQVAPLCKPSKRTILEDERSVGLRDAVLVGDYRVDRSKTAAKGGRSCKRLRRTLWKMDTYTKLILFILIIDCRIRASSSRVACHRSLATFVPSLAFQPTISQPIRKVFLSPVNGLFLSTSSSTGSVDESTTISHDGPNVIKPSYYETHRKLRNGRSIWEPRKQLKDLKLGEPLEGYIVQKYMEGVTGAKIFLEVGVGQYNTRKQTWQIVHAMMRMGHAHTKASVTSKRLARLRKKDVIECYVSRIQLGCGRLEVVQNKEDVPKEKDLNKTPVSSLQPGQEVIGTVRKLVPYGAFVDVGANRIGLLHIQKVADLYGCYIDKVKGLEEAGLECGARIRVQVESNEKRRLFLDFTSAVKDDARKEQADGKTQKEEQQQVQEQRAVPDAGQSYKKAPTSTSTIIGASSSSTQEAEEVDNVWSEYATDYGDLGSEDDEDGDYHGYDEDRDIEDALGLGTY